MALSLPRAWATVWARASPRRERSGPSEQTPPEGQVPPALPQEERRPAGSPSQGRQVQPGEVQGWCAASPAAAGETRAVSGVASPGEAGGARGTSSGCRRTTSCCPGRVTSTGAARKESWRGDHQPQGQQRPTPGTTTAPSPARPGPGRPKGARPAPPRGDGHRQDVGKPCAEKFKHPSPLLPARSGRLSVPPGPPFQ